MKKVLTYSKQGHKQSQYFSDVAEHYEGYGKMKEKSPKEVTLVRLSVNSGILSMSRGWQLLSITM